jgi:peptidoglycan/LPS O-acetylase OafA/YrhL
MFNNPHFDRLRQSFSDQFEPDGSSFLYRKWMKGAPIRISREERDEFVRAFNRRLRYSAWSIVPTTVILILLLAWLVPDTKSATANFATYFGIALILFPFMAGYYWAWNAPARALVHRPEVGPPRSRQEARKIGFSKMTYGQLGFAALAGIALVWKVSADTDIRHGWGRLWLVFAGLLIAGAGVQALRKWRIER